MRDVGSILESGDCSDGYVGFALEVIRRMAARRQAGVGELRTALLNRMVEIATSPEGGSATQIIAELRKARVTDDEILDFYIPESARAFGQAWLDDRMSFAQVTIGTGCLQEMLSTLQSGWTADLTDPFCDSSVLVIVPPGEQHTLGSLVLASALRRQGISVCLQIAPGLSDLSRLLDERRFDAMMISLGSSERVEVSAKLVKTLRQLTKGQLRMAIGGSVIETCRQTLEDTGADLVTNDLSAVIAEFGLVRQDTARRAG